MLEALDAFDAPLGTERWLNLVGAKPEPWPKECDGLGGSPIGPPPSQTLLKPPMEAVL